MLVSTYTSELVNKILKSRQEFKIYENKGIIPLVNDSYLQRDLIVAVEKSTLIKDIEVFKGGFVFDCLEEVFSLVECKGLYFSKNYYDRNIDVFKHINTKVINRESLDIKIFKEVYKIFLNKLVRSTHISKIIYLNINFVSKNKSFPEEELVYKYNNILKNYSEIIKELSPGMIIVDLECVVSRIDGNIDYSIDNEVIDDIICSFKSSKGYQGEKIYPSIYPIKYNFEKANIFNKDKLIIIYSAFSADGAKYNYKNTLKFIDCNKLFILDDFGTKGSYYLGINGDMDIESSVISLITKIISENKIEFKNIISIGSSKGGTAALYYGLKYNFGSVIIGAPQYKIGSYLSDLSVKQYAYDIFGEINHINRIKYDNIIRLCCPKNSNTNIYMITSEGDKQYKKVLREFIEVSKEFNLNLQVQMCEITNHAEISTEFPPYLIEKLKEVLKGGCFDNSFTDKIFKKVTKLMDKIEKR